MNFIETLFTIIGAIVFVGLMIWLAVWLYHRYNGRVRGPATPTKK
jgi:hypothetical protein